MPNFKSTWSLKVGDNQHARLDYKRTQRQIKLNKNCESKLFLMLFFHSIFNIKIFSNNNFKSTHSLQLVTDVCDTVTNVVVVVVSLSPTHFLRSHSFNTASSLNGCNTSLTLFGPVFTVDLSNLKLAVVFPSVDISVASVTIAPFLVLETTLEDFPTTLPFLLLLHWSL